VEGEIKLTENEDEYETRKIHISVPVSLYDYLRKERLFKSIDGIIVNLLMEHYDLK